jgi:hypothetical protein
MKATKSKSTVEDAALLPKLLLGELRLPSPRLRQTGVPAVKNLSFLNDFLNQSYASPAKNHS